MKSTLRYSFLFLLFLLGACNGGDQNGEGAESENDIDAARNFIQSALQGNFNRARTFMLIDSINEGHIFNAQRVYNEKMKAEEKKGLYSASINIHDVNEKNDSTTIVIYSNSYRNNHDTLKVIKLNGQWLVDLKYLFEHDQDSSRINHSNSFPPIKTDSVK